MKNKLYLMFTFVLMFFIFDNRVYADVPLNCKIGDDSCSIDSVIDEIKKSNDNNSPLCIYEVNYDGNSYYNYIYSDSNGGYMSGTTFSSLNTITWSIARRKTSLVAFGSDNISYNNIHYITDDGIDKLNGSVCPNYSYFGHDVLKGGYICYDSDGGCSKNDALTIRTIYSDSKLVYSNDADFTINSSYYKYCNKNNDRKKYCTYYDSKNDSDKFFVFKMNTLDGYSSSDNKVIYNGKSNTGNVIFINDQSNNNCPSVVYEYVTGSKKTFITYESTSYGKLSRKYLLDNCYKDNGNTSNVVSDCDGLISNELRNVINEIMSYIRIGVPLLLIGLIILDFVKATFANDDKAISKSKNNAIKRIIIAVVIFLVPTILNLIFNVANDVWKDNHYEICGLDNN